MFLNEFVRHNIALNNSSEKYVCIDNQKKLHKENSKRGFFNSAFSPFAFKIVNVPGSALEEKYSLFYEEVREPFFFIYFGRIFPWQKNPFQAFFLCFALGCLTVFRTNTYRLSIAELWKNFMALDPRFPFRYAVYHKLRSKGWVLKCGLKYGCDFRKLWAMLNLWQCVDWIKVS